MPVITQDCPSDKTKAGYLNQPCFYSIVVVIAWGLIPSLAKVADFPGGFTTFWVNVFSALGVLAIMLFKGYFPQFKAYQYYRRFIVLSIVWPLAYSLSYFSVINASSGSLATLLNYLWPLFALILLTRKMRIPPLGIALAVVGLLSISVTLLLEGSFELLIGPLIFGLIIPFTQAYFNVATTDEAKYPGTYAWLLTFIGAVVTVIGSAIFIILFENAEFLADATPSSFLPLAFMGIVANGIGFFAFLRAGQLSKTPTQKIWFILTMFLVPFAQVFFLLIGVEPDISPMRLVGIFIVALAFLTLKLWETHVLPGQNSTRANAN